MHGMQMVNQFEDRNIVYTSDGQTVLAYFGLDGISKTAYVGFNSLFFLVYFTLAYLALSHINWGRR